MFNILIIYLQRKFIRWHWRNLFRTEKNFQREFYCTRVSNRELIKRIFVQYK